MDGLLLDVMTRQIEERLRRTERRDLLRALRPCPDLPARLQLAVARRLVRAGERIARRADCGCGTPSGTALAR